jgi:hypothetical protein
MDPVSIIANVIAIAQLTSKIIKYLNRVRSAPKECRQVKVEAANLYSLIIRLQCNLEQDEANGPWLNSVRELALPGGPFEQYHKALKLLESKITMDTFSKKVKLILLWTFTDEEIVRILKTIKLLSNQIMVALEMDHL